MGVAVANGNGDGEAEATTAVGPAGMVMEVGGACGVKTTVAVGPEAVGKGVLTAATNVGVGSSLLPRVQPAVPMLIRLTATMPMHKDTATLLFIPAPFRGCGSGLKGLAHLRPKRLRTNSGFAILP